MFLFPIIVITDVVIVVVVVVVVVSGGDGSVGAFVGGFVGGRVINRVVFVFITDSRLCTRKDFALDKKKYNFLFFKF